MSIIYKNEEKNKRYLPHELKSRKNAVKTYRNGNPIATHYSFSLSNSGL